MRIAVLNPSYEGSTSDFSGHDPVCDPSPWLPDHEVERHAIRKATATAQVRKLVDDGYDVFVNLCDGAWEEDRAGIEVVQQLERCGAAFTGADARFYEPTREAMKRVCHAWDIRTPEHAFVQKDSDVAHAARHLRFPVIVKHENSYGSIGMGRDARCESASQLRERAAVMIERFGGALLEEFIAGREFTVLASEDGAGGVATYQPVECRFPEGETFKHFDLKWKEYEGMSWFPVADAALGERLRDIGARMFRGLDGVGYGRSDLRMDADGGLYLLEINPNCGIFYPQYSWGSADMILSFDPVGHRGFLERILTAALRRREARQPRFDIRYVPGVGYGMFAARDLRAGELVDPHEERAHHLVTRQHVVRSWGPVQQGWFGQYAWPLGDDTHVIWDPDPMRWKPIDHSCDPNAWLEGLDLVARRDIPRGEQITMDYATFCGDAMSPFPCRCGAAACRGTIAGTDWAQPFVSERYGRHVSDWVARSRRARGLEVAPTDR